jgi:hypothetical protein
LCARNFSDFVRILSAIAHVHFSSDQYGIGPIRAPVTIDNTPTITAIQNTRLSDIDETPDSRRKPPEKKHRGFARELQ